MATLAAAPALTRSQITDALVEEIRTRTGKQVDFERAASGTAIRWKAESGVNVIFVDEVKGTMTYVRLNHGQPMSGHVFTNIFTDGSERNQLLALRQ